MSKPGVGYTPSNPVSRYRLDSVGAQFQSFLMELTADPWAVTGDPYSTDLSAEAAKDAYEHRYGPYTARTVEPDRPGEQHWFKSWVGPNNEVRFVVIAALKWAFDNKQFGLGDPSYNGTPTDREILDLQATGEHQIWEMYFQSTVDGYSPERRVTVNDANLPPGDSSHIEPFWGMPFFVHNTYAAPAPVDPPPPVDPPAPPALPPVDHHVLLDPIDLHTISVMGGWTLTPYWHKAALLKRLADNLAKATAIVEP